MTFQAETGIIRWKIHFISPREKVFAALATDEGRACHWAESAPEVDGKITFNILGYEPFSGWVSVLMAMKAAVDHGVDLRNHDTSRTWNDGYADN